MASYRDRYRARRDVGRQKWDAIGYVCCHRPDDWEMRCPLRRSYTSVEAMNPFFREQRNAIRRHARNHGLKIWRTFRDSYGSHPQSIHLRHGLAALIVEIERRGIDKIIVDDARHVSTDLAELGVLLSFLDSIKVTVIESRTGLNLSKDGYYQQFVDPTDKVAFFRLAKSLRMLKARVTRLKKGSVLGRKPHRTSPEERLAVRRIVELRRRVRQGVPRKSLGHQRRLSFTRIANILNKENLTTRTGKPWRGAAVRRVIAQTKKSWLSG